MAYKIKQKKPTFIEEPYGLPRELQEKDKFAPQEKEDIFKEPNEKTEEGNNFQIEDTKKALESQSDSFEEKGQEDIAEIQQDLYSEDIPIEIQDRTTLIVKAGGESHIITRKDISEYQRRYGLEGEDGRDISGFRQLGTIQGDWRPINDIATDVTFVFGKLDTKAGNYKTSYSDE